MFIALSLFVATLLVLYFWLQSKDTKAQNYWPKLGVVYLDTGNMFVNMMKKKLNFAERDQEAYDKLKAHRFGGVLEMWSPVLYITDLDLMKSVYIKDFDHFVNRRGFDLEKNDPHMHLSLFNQSGEAWKSLRSKMSPTFTTGKIRRMFEIFDSSAQKLVKAVSVESNSSLNGNFDVRLLFQKFTMDVIGSAAFGLETNMFDDPNSQFAKMGKKIQMQFAGINLVKFLFITFWPKLAEFCKISLTDAEADKFLSRVIIDSLNHRTRTGQARNDFLQIMLEARLGKVKKEYEDIELDAHERNAQLKQTEDSHGNPVLEFTDDLIIAQSLLFILAGFDTMESLLDWATYELALNPEVQEKLLEEVNMAAQDGGGKFSYDVINKLEYLDMFISETLRKYPPAFRTERRSTKPYTIPGTDIILPKDSVVAFPILALHRDPEFWPEPDRFDPLRFTKENVNQRHPIAYQPFGHGPRNCIGNRFALTEGKIVIAQLVRNFKFEPCDKTTIPPVFVNGGTLKPIDGMWLKITSRQ